MSQYSDFFDRKCLNHYLMVVALMFLLMKLTSGAGFGIAIPLAFMALVGRKTERLFFWLLFSVATVVANGHIAVKGAAYAWEQRVMLVSLGGCMAVSVLGTKKQPIMRPYLFLFAYLVFMTIPSALGWAPLISFLKLILFVLIYFAYFGVANRVGSDIYCSSKRIRSIMLVFAIIFIFGSMVLLPFPGISQMKGEEYKEAIATGAQLTSLFTGMTAHSQCLGPVVSMFAIILFGDMLFSIKKIHPLYLSLLACCPFLIYKTSSRTGMGAFLLGIMFILFYFMRTRGVSSRWRSRISSMVMMVGVVLVVLFAISGSGGVKRFALKKADSGISISAESVMSSRQGKIDEALENFKDSPIIGNGFQVSKDLLTRGWGASYLSAPIEKGVWVTAVLEEGGVIGFCLFVVFLMITIFGSIRRKAYVSASCLFTFTMLNLGEFTFFSMSYTGGICWALIFVAAALDVRRLGEDQAPLNFCG